MSKKILIIYTTVGLGHKYVALNIGNHLRASGYEVRLEDILQVQSGKLVDVSKKVYLWLINSVPSFWKFLYMNKFLIKISLPLRTRVAGGDHYQRTKQLIEEYDPDVVIATQTAASAVVAYLKQQGYYKKLFGISFSDFHFHRYWFYDEADFYFTNIAEQKDELIKLGFPEDKILITGIPLSKSEEFDKAEVKARLGITTRKTVLVTAGSLGFGINKKYVLNLLSKLKDKLSDFTVIVVCGKDKALADELSTISDDKLKVFGFYTPMDELYTAADVFVGKPGGLSTAEALQKRLPIIITHWMPGGEDLNVAYLTKNRLTMPVSNPGSNRGEEIIKETVSELETGAFKKELETKTQEIKTLVNLEPDRISGFMKRILG